MEKNIFKRASKFYAEVMVERRKVSWPTRRETVMTALSVFVLAMIAAVFFVLCDTIIHKTLQFLQVV